MRNYIIMPDAHQDMAEIFSYIASNNPIAATKLLDALFKAIEMLHAPQSAEIVFLPKDQQAVWQDANNITRRNISPVIEGSKMEWLYVEIPVGASIQKCVSLNTQDLKKYICVTKGVLEINIEQQMFRLKKGDSLYFDATSTHDFVNAGKEIVGYHIVMKHP